MKKQFISAVLLLGLTLAFSAFSLAQDAAKSDAAKEQKMEASKDAKSMGPLKSITCDPACGFMVRSHDEKEVIAMAKSHAKKKHKMDLTDAKAKEMMKSEDATNK